MRNSINCERQINASVVAAVLRINSEIIDCLQDRGSPVRVRDAGRAFALSADALTFGYDRRYKAFAFGVASPARFNQPNERIDSGLRHILLLPIGKPSEPSEVTPIGRPAIPSKLLSQLPRRHRAVFA